MREIKKIIIHCSAATWPKQNVKWIDKIHRENRGFKSCGYHKFIRFDGLIEQGRPDEEVGAHCKGYNHNSIGICLAGLREYTEAQMSSLKKLLAELKAKYPKATLHGHYEFANKECPAFDMAELKKWYLELEIPKPGYAFEV